MQKFWKIASRMSSLLTSPVIEARAAAAAIMSTATISGGIRESAEAAGVLEGFQSYRERVAMTLAGDCDLIADVDADGSN